MEKKLTVRDLVNAFVIWLSTNTIAAIIYFTCILTGVTYEPFLCQDCMNGFLGVIVLGLAFSSPAIVLLVPCLYFLNDTSGRKIMYGLCAILALCAIIIFIFFWFFEIPTRERSTITIFLTPYIIGALISFFMVFKKSLLIAGK